MATQKEKDDAIAYFVRSGKEKPRDTRSGPSSPRSSGRSSRPAPGGSALGGAAAKILEVADDLWPW
ncbi:hypothetical protein AB0L00_37450 [Actinoallomurus sp. NPDC052308]|uniref:hypothetical protein n=1 Tax=Actinoallomurus sp. NPDC052308 TaxID=3155530 RepID=UPI003429752B